MTRTLGDRQSAALWLGWCLVGLFACDAPVIEPDGEPHEQAGQAVVYGEDDRLDVYAHPDASLRALARQSVVALVPGGAIDERDPTDVQIDGDTLQSARFLCDDERFGEQSTGAFCSGTLIDDDLVLTAGHCVETQSECQGMRFVFDYMFEAEGRRARITSDEVYGCQRLVVQRLDDEQDYAIVQLDRPVTGDHGPAPVEREAVPVEADQPVTCIGFPSGIPAKIDSGGRVTQPRAGPLDFFRATTDTFGGNSGSGIFDEAGRVVGILVRGATDYVFDRGCFRVNELPEQGGNPFGEEINYAFRAIDALCDAGFESPTLCGDEPVGEGGFCDVCEGDGDCLPDFACRPYAENPRLSTCSAPCDIDGDCRPDHACDAGVCRPRTTRACVDGDVWTVSSCGTELAIFQPCGVDQVCSGGQCVTPADGGDLVIDVDEVEVVPSDPVEGEPFEVLVTVRNRGDEILVGQTLVEVFDERGGVRVRVADPQVIDQPLVPGEPIELSFDITFDVAGPYLLAIVGDPGEPDEPANNTALFEVVVQDDDDEGPVFGDIVVEEAGGDGDGLIEEGEQIRVRWTVSDPSGVAERQVSIDGIPTLVTFEDEVVIGPLEPGQHLIELQARDADNSPATSDPVGRQIVVEAIRPRVTETSPFNGAEGVSLQAQVVAVFSQALNPATVRAGTLEVTLNGEPVAGAVEYDEVARRVVFIPTAPLQGGSVYVATIFGVTDLQGDPMEAPFTWVFSTLEEVSPTVLEITAPREGDVLSGQVEVVGTATAGGFIGYQLGFAVGDEEPLPIGEQQFGQVVDGLLGVWDTTEVEDGQYRLFVAMAFGDDFEVIFVERLVTVLNNPEPVIESIALEPEDVTAATVGPVQVVATVDEGIAPLQDGAVTLAAFVDGQLLLEVVMSRVAPGVWRAPVDFDWANLGGALMRLRVTAERSQGARASVTVSEAIEVVDAPPVFLPLPVLTVGENDVAADALDLRDFARDDLTPAANLRFSLRSTGVPQVSASLTQGSRLTLSASDNFVGVTTLTVTVNDGSLTTNGLIRVEVTPDTGAPQPDPPRFNLRPTAAVAPDTAVMTVAAVSDRSGVEYFFEETSGNPGGDDSGWIGALEFRDEGLIPGRTYTYRVRARDLSSRRNQSAFSATASVTMPGQCDVCEAGARQCGGGGVEICRPDQRGCTDWEPGEPCGAGTTCQAGRCVEVAISVFDSCLAGLLACYGDGARLLECRVDEAASAIDADYSGERVVRYSEVDGPLSYRARTQRGEQLCYELEAFEDESFAFEDLATGERYDVTAGPQGFTVICADGRPQTVVGDELLAALPRPPDAEDCESGPVNPVCVSDAFEPNNDPSLALWLQPGFYDDLASCDDDWYAIDLRAGESLTLIVSGGESQMEMGLRLFEDGGETLLASADDLGADKTLEWLALEDASLVWQVSLLSERGGAYTMDVDVALPQGSVCELEARQCAGRAAYQICSPGDAGAPVWGEPVLCEAGLVCGEDGACREPVVEEMEAPQITDRFLGERRRVEPECACATPTTPSPRLPWPLALVGAAALSLLWRRREA